MSYFSAEFDERVIDLLNAGGVGFMPSDTIYGLSCAALNRPAVEKIHRLKRRDAGKPLIALIADLKMLDLLSIDKKQSIIVEKYWPGALSVVFSSTDVPAWLQLGTGSLAVRLPANDRIRKLIRRTGPLVSTSANLQGGQPVTNVEAAKRLFSDELDFYVDTGELDGLSSTLAVIENGHLKVIRQGAVRIN